MLRTTTFVPVQMLLRGVGALAGALFVIVSLTYVVGVWMGGAAHPPGFLTAPVCDRPCWMGIQTDVATFADVETLLVSMGTDYSANSISDTGSNISLSPQGSGDLIFLSGGRVNRIVLAREVCAVALLAAYGAPDGLTIQQDGKFELTYVQLGAIFEGKHNTVTLIELSRPAELAVRFRGGVLTKPWRLAEATFRQPCD